jgi:hypothetical protein
MGLAKIAEDAGGEKAGQELGKEGKGLSHTETQSSQRKQINDVEYLDLDAFMRMCISEVG